MIKIGTAVLRHGLLLGPMAGYSDHAMRAICRAYGAEYAVTEMVSAKAAVYGDKKTFALARIFADEGPVALQIFGSEPSVMAEGAAILASHTEEGCVPPVAIDINMGCPVRKIFQNGEGSALMRDPERIGRITEAVAAAVSLPVTVKLRAGVDRAHVNAAECAIAAEEGGAALVTVHGRTREQMYGGRADPSPIRAVKERLHIPVIANGDAVSAKSALSLLRETGADGVMIARGAVGNPFLFSEITAALTGGTFAPPDLAARRGAALLQLRLAVAQKGERVAVSECRKQIALYFTGFRGSAALRDRVHRCETQAEIEAAIAAFTDGQDS